MGYLRLGDDMSRYGSAFLSLDAGASFLDGGATSIVAASTPLVSPMLRLSRTHSGGFGPSSASPLDAPPSTGASTGRARSASAGRRRLSVDSTAGEGDDAEAFPAFSPAGIAAGGSKGSARSPYALAKELDDVREALQLLSEPEFKWAERVEALRRMGHALSRVAVAVTSAGGTTNTSTDVPEGLLTEVISALTVSVTKQKNPHVLRFAVCCVRVVGGFAAGRASCGVAWRTLLVETVHLLRYARPSPTKPPSYQSQPHTLL